LVGELCPARFAEEYPSRAECETSCVGRFVGAPAYTVSVAESSGGLPCRMLELARLAEGGGSCEDVFDGTACDGALAE
jgi:hypothetical protein